MIFVLGFYRFTVLLAPSDSNFQIYIRRWKSDQTFDRWRATLSPPGCCSPLLVASQRLLFPPMSKYLYFSYAPFLLFKCMYFSFIPLPFAHLVCINFLVPTSLFPLACNHYSLCVPFPCSFPSFILFSVFFFNFLSCLVFLFVGMIADVFLLLIKFSYTISFFLFLFWAFLSSLISTFFTLFLFSYYNWIVNSLDFFISSNTLTIFIYFTLIYVKFILLSLHFSATNYTFFGAINRPPF